MSNVLYIVNTVLPSRPVISGHEKKVYHAGATVTLSCVTYGGTPAPKVVWTKRALESPDVVGGPVWMRVNHSHARSESPNETRSDVTFVVAKEDNNIEYRCEVVASSRNRDVFNATVRLQVGCTLASERMRMRMPCLVLSCLVFTALTTLSTQSTSLHFTLETLALVAEWHAGQGKAAHVYANEAHRVKSTPRRGGQLCEAQETPAAVCPLVPTSA